MSSQVEHDLLRVLTAIDRVMEAIKNDEKDTAISRLDDIKNEVEIMLYVMEGYSVEEAEKLTYD